MIRVINYQIETIITYFFGARLVREGVKWKSFFAALGKKDWNEKPDPPRGTPLSFLVLPLLVFRIAHLAGVVCFTPTRAKKRDPLFMISTS